MALYNTLQEVFDKVWDHFVVDQAPQSVLDTPVGPTCQYRGLDGARCAIGVCLPDSEFVDEMEGHTIVWISGHMPKTYARVFNGLSEGKLCDLQTTHDWYTARPGNDLTFSESIKQRLIDFADRNYLTIPEGATTND